jgi:ComEC/Rec2-related protein
MKFVFILLFCAIFSTVASLPNLTAKLSAHLQDRCRIYFHKPSESSQIVEAYLCGADLPEGPTREIFIQTSLYHLIVVSGSHLSFLSLILNLIGLRYSFFQFVFSVGLALVTGLQPPVVRALFQQLVSEGSGHFRWHWRSIQQIILGSFLALSFFPMWISSLSLQLSLGACLSLDAGKLLTKPNSAANSKLKALESAALTYLFLLPLLWGWGQLHPFGILTNFFIAPILAGVLWLLCGVWVFSPLVATSGFEFCLRLLAKLAPIIPLTTSGESLQTATRWIYILALGGTLWGLQIHQQRSR